MVIHAQRIDQRDGGAWPGRRRNPRDSCSAAASSSSALIAGRGLVQEQPHQVAADEEGRHAREADDVHRPRDRPGQEVRAAVPLVDDVARDGEHRGHHRLEAECAALDEGAVQILNRRERVLQGHDLLRLLASRPAAGSVPDDCRRASISATDSKEADGGTCASML